MAGAPTEIEGGGQDEREEGMQKAAYRMLILLRMFNLSGIQLG